MESLQKAILLPCPVKVGASSICQVEFYAKGKEYWISHLNGVEWQECQNNGQSWKKKAFCTVLFISLGKNGWSPGTSSLTTIASPLVCILVFCTFHMTLEKCRVSGSLEESEWKWGGFLFSCQWLRSLLKIPDFASSVTICQRSSPPCSPGVQESDSDHWLPNSWFPAWNTS